MRRVVALIAALTLNITTVCAQIGDCGFEGGISSGRITLTNGKRSETQTFPYSEIVFVTGEPLVFSGTVTLTKTQKTDSETYSYRYTLTNGIKNKLTRTCVYEADLRTSGGQVIRTMSNKPGATPRETIVVNGVTYNLETSNNRYFSLGTVTDKRPACDYYAGNWNSEKVYRTKDGRQVSVNLNSQLYGYDQHWGSVQVQEIKLYISGLTERTGVYDMWGGSGTIKISQTTSNKLLYIENKPDAISFEGGYLRHKEQNSILEYNISLPLFDSEGIALDTVTSYSDTLKLSALPEQERLAVADTSAIKGHWYEKSIGQLASLGILGLDYLVDYTRLERNMTRKEFATAIAKAVSVEAVPLPVPDKKTGYVEKPFIDVDINDPSYEYIYTLYKKGVMSGTGDRIFSPNEPITRAQALVTIVRLLGLESAGGEYAVTHFRDNDAIPAWAKSAVLAAAKIKIVKGDENNFLNPNSYLTGAAAATLISNMISYLMDDMILDYRDRAFKY